MITTNDKEKWQGIDKSLEISLFDYGIICQWDNDNKEYFCIYRYMEEFFPGSIDENGINEKLELDKNGLLSFVGMNEKDWKKLEPIMKIFDLYHYFGPLETFGENIYNEYYTPKELLELTGISMDEL